MKKSKILNIAGQIALGVVVAVISSWLVAPEKVSVAVENIQTVPEGTLGFLKVTAIAGVILACVKVIELLSDLFDFF